MLQSYGRKSLKQLFQGSSKILPPVKPGSFFGSEPFQGFNTEGRRCCPVVTDNLKLRFLMIQQYFSQDELGCLFPPRLVGCLMTRSCVLLSGAAVFMVSFFSLVWMSALSFVLKGSFLFLILPSMFTGSICRPVFVFINKTIQLLLDSTDTVFLSFYHTIPGIGTQSKVICLAQVVSLDTQVTWF